MKLKNTSTALACIHRHIQSMSFHSYFLSFFVAVERKVQKKCCNFGKSTNMKKDSDTSNKGGRASIVEKAMRLWTYFNSGIWSDTRRSWWINALRTLNLSINSFLNRDIQSQACAMTYRTMLAVVPALAMLIGIGRGFGIQNVLEEELFRLFPAQHYAIKYGIQFVDSYLKQSSEGIFVGVGIAFLLWTLISLISNMEDTFNLIWGQVPSRSIWRKITDYTAMLLILPVLLICASGISLLLSSTLNSIFHFEFMTPVISILLEVASWIMTWLFFAAIYLLLPNTKVKIKNALISGVLAGSAFIVLQWLFVSGTLYVTRYNAIYGSVAFLPLMLIWMQLAWVICLAGAVICYSSQNVFAFSLDREVASISIGYRSKAILAICAIVTHRFIDEQGPATARDLMEAYELPARMVTNVTDLLCRAGVFSRVLLPDSKDVYGYQLAVDPSALSIGILARKIDQTGTSGFVPEFASNFPGVESASATLGADFLEKADTILIRNIEIKNKTIQHPLKPI